MCKKCGLLRETTEEIKNFRSRLVGSSMFSFGGQLTLLSNKPNPFKIVYLLPSYNEDAKVDENSGKLQMTYLYL